MNKQKIVTDDFYLITTEYTFFPNGRYRPGASCTSSLNIFKRVEILQNMFFDPNGVKVCRNQDVKQKNKILQIFGSSVKLLNQ